MHTERNPSIIITGVRSLQKTETAFSFLTAPNPQYYPGQKISIGHPCPEWLENGCVVKITFDPPEIHLVLPAAKNAAEMAGVINPFLQDKHANYKAKRNDLCPCGSGKKYKKCHG